MAGSGIVLYGVEGKPRWESFSQGIDAEGKPSAEIEYYIENALQANVFIRGLKGIQATTGGVTTRAAPHILPHSEYMMCLAAYWKGVAEAESPDGWPRFDGAIVYASYGVPSITFSGGPTGEVGANTAANFDDTPGCEDSLKGATEVVVRPDGSFRYRTAPQLPIDVGSPVFVGRESFVRRIPNCPNMNELTAQLRALKNKLNTAEVWGCARGTIRVGDFDTQLSYINGTPVVDLSFSLEWREFDWNKVIRRDTGVWDFAENTAGALSYDYADLTPLIGLHYDLAESADGSDWPTGYDSEGYPNLL